MFPKQTFSLSLLLILGLCFSGFAHAAPAGAGQATELPEKMEPGQQMQHQHGQQEHHHLHMTMGEEKCDPKFTYEEGPLGPQSLAGTVQQRKDAGPN